MVSNLFKENIELKNKNYLPDNQVEKPMFRSND